MNNFPQKWTFPRLTNALLTLFVVISATASISSKIAYAQSATQPSSIGETLSPTVRCSANPSSILSGEVSTIAAVAVSPRNSPLIYSFSASAGVISGSGATAAFASTGAPSGPVSITCGVADEQGQTASASVVVTIFMPLAPPPPHSIQVERAIPDSPLPLPMTPPVPLPPPLAARESAKAVGRGIDWSAEVLASNHTLTGEAAGTRKTALKQEASKSGVGGAISAWKKGLKEGVIEYGVPPVMKAQQPSTVMVRIHGFQNTTGWQPMLGVTGQGKLQVSNCMRVDLKALQDPGEFTIASLDPTTVKFVPDDGYQTWTWSVTPAHGAKDQKLTIRAYLEYDSCTAPDYELDDQNYTVNVEVLNLSTVIVWDFQKHPIEWLKYMLPGGSGWAALAALVTSLGGLAWWKKKKK